jgi:hypothetical protein
MDEPDNNTVPAKPQSSGWAPFRELAEGSFVLGALIYAAGWNYLYAYYHAFGLTLRDVSPTSSDVLVFSMRVFYDSWLSILIIPVIAGLTLYIVNTERGWLPPRPVTTGLILFFSFLVLSWFARRVGRIVANQDTNQGTTSLPGVRLMLDKPDQSDPDFDREEFRLLGRMGGQVYIFQPVDPETMKRAGLPEGNLRIYVIPDSRVREVRIERGL